MPELTKEEIISNIYYDLEDGFSSKKKTLEDAQKVRATITKEDVDKWFSKQPNKQIKNYKNHNSYVAPYPRYEYQIDIMDMVDLQKDETQPRYALIVIDIFSKLGYAEPMFNKDSPNVLKGLKNSFNEMGYPINIYSDDDGAFKSVVKTFFDDNGINHITTRTHANVVERFIRTIKNGIHDRVRFNKAKWEEMLKHVINKYNKTIHSSTGLSPIDGHKDKNSFKIITALHLKSNYKRKYNTISIGDSVKYFNKGRGNYVSRKETTSKWSNTIHKVSNIEYDVSLNKHYILEGLPGKTSFLRHEILLVD